MDLSEKIRTLLSTWMARYAQPLVEECAQEAEQLKTENEALRELLDDLGYTQIHIDPMLDALFTGEKEERVHPMTLGECVDAERKDE